LLTDLEQNRAEMKAPSLSNDDGPPWHSPVARLSLWPFVAVCTGVFFMGGIIGSLDLLKNLIGFLLYAVPLCWWAVTTRQRGHSVSEVMGPWPTCRQLALMLVTVFAFLAFRVGCFSVLASLDLIPEYWIRAAQARAAQPPPAWLDFLIAVLVAPCVEEVLFRGIVFRRSLRRMRPVFAALWSSLLFGLLHFDFVGSIVFGVVMVALYVQSGSLWLAIAAHALNNASSSLVGDLVDARGSWGWAIAGVQIVCLPWLVWLVARGLRRRAVPMRPDIAAAELEPNVG
jgi:membrane protease YdiL (CAAX protease family)